MIEKPSFMEMILKKGFLLYLSVLEEDNTGLIFGPALLSREKEDVVHEKDIRGHQISSASDDSHTLDKITQWPMITE